MCQKVKSLSFTLKFPLLGLSSLPNHQNFEKKLMFGSAFRRVQFYSMIYYIAILVKSLELNKSMKELDYSSNFWSKVKQDFLDFSKKIWESGGPSLHDTRDPQNVLFQAYWGSRVSQGEGSPDPKFFLGSQGSHIRPCSKNQMIIPTPSWIFLSSSDLTKIAIE